MKTKALLFAVCACTAVFLSGKVYGVPSFARQTGLQCFSCHTVFPELRPLGRTFKLSGYTMSNKSNPEFPPLAAMAQFSYTEAKGLDNEVAPFDDSPQAKFNLPQQASVFYGGRITEHSGAMAQLTYDGVGNSIALDNTDVRYARQGSAAGKNIIYGLTLNNGPTVQDAWNTTPAWGFPFAKSSVAPSPAARALIDNQLNQQVGGLGAYAFWDDFVYAEMTVYRTARRGITRPLAAGTTVDTAVDDAAPYWRLLFQRVLQGRHVLSAGTYGMTADVYPPGLIGGPTDRFTDIAADGQYQYLGENQSLTVQTTWIHEKQDWDAGFPLGNTANPSDNLNTVRINANWYYFSPGLALKGKEGAIGGSFGWFSIRGDSDPLLYPPGISRTGDPDSSGFILELDYLFREKARLSLQYTIYDKFNGSSSNYDGSGRNASDNNTLYLVLWVAL